MLCLQYAVHSILCMQFVCVTYVVQKQHGLIVLSHRTRLQSAPDPCSWSVHDGFNFNVVHLNDNERET